MFSREVFSFPRGDAVAEDRTAYTGDTCGDGRASRTAPALEELRARSSRMLGSPGSSAAESFSEI